MSSSDRRMFFKRSASLLSTLAVAGCDAAGGVVAEGSTRSLNTETMRAIGEVVLPSELGADGMTRVLEDFRRWLADFEPVAELTHGYGSAEIRYGPADPAPRWQAQLEALELEARKRHGQGFAALSRDERQVLLRREASREGPGMPNPLQAQHVALGLMAYFFGTPEATDLCYRADIGAYRCRGLQSAVVEPAPLQAGV
jgi:hypothetical protein